MADLNFDPNPQLRQEYVDALAVMDPQIEGLEFFLKIIPTDHEFYSVVETEYNNLRARRHWITEAIATLDAVIAAREALESDNYPVLNQVRLTADMFAELEEDKKGFEAAVAIFEPVPALAVNLGQPESKK